MPEMMSPATAGTHCPARIQYAMSGPDRNLAALMAFGALSTSRRVHPVPAADPAPPTPGAALASGSWAASRNEGAPSWVWSVLLCSGSLEIASAELGAVPGVPPPAAEPWAERL